jgi:hypothetical protein
MVRSVFPNLIAHDLVSVQPMPGPVSQVFYLRYIYNATKGGALAGQDITENPNPMYTSEKVENEAIGASGTDNYTGNIDYRPVRPGSLVLTDGTQIVTDNGQGALIGDVDGGGTNTIDYTTGAFDVTFAASTTGDVLGTYEYNLEGNEDIPELDLTIESSPVTARMRKLRVRWSVEANHDLRVLYGLDGEAELSGAMGNEMKYGMDREIIADLDSIAYDCTAAGAAFPVQAWPMTPPGGPAFSYTEHKLGIMDMFTQASNVIFERTQRAIGSWIVAGVAVCNVLETLPQFRREGTLSGRGVYRVGTIGEWPLYKDSYMDRYSWLMGHRGTAMFETGYVWAPYVPIYTTPLVRLDDFLARKAIGSRYGKKTVDNRFYVKGSITAGSPYGT